MHRWTILCLPRPPSLEPAQPAPGLLSDADSAIAGDPTDTNVSIVFLFVGLALVLGLTIAFLGAVANGSQPIESSVLVSTLILAPVLLLLAGRFAHRPPIKTAQQLSLGLLAMALLGRSLYVALGNPDSLTELAALIPVLFGAGFYLRSPIWLTSVILVASAIASRIILTQPGHDGGTRHHLVELSGSRPGSSLCQAQSGDHPEQADHQRTPRTRRCRSDALTSSAHHRRLSSHGQRQGLGGASDPDESRSKNSSWTRAVSRS